MKLKSTMGFFHDVVPNTFCLRVPAIAVLTVAPNTPNLTSPVRTLAYCGARSTGFTLYPVKYIRIYHGL